MAESLYYINLTKREYFSVGTFGGSDNHHAVGRGLEARALGILLRGRWCEDSIAVDGDFRSDWLEFKATLKLIEREVIELIFRSVDGFEPLGEAADRDTSLYLKLCHLIATRQLLDLEPHMKEKFGHRFMDRYKNQDDTYRVINKEFYELPDE